nr:unnamed protein product [Callosobruchus analis]
MEQMLCRVCMEYYEP